MARIKREFGVDGQACAFIICHEKDGVVYKPPYLDLGYAFHIEDCIALTFWHESFAMIRTYRPRIDTLQQFPAISVSVTTSRTSSLRANVPIFSLASRGAKFRDATYYTTYRNVSVYSKNFFESFLITNQPAQQVIISVISIPSAFIAGYAIELPFFGRRGTLATFSCEYIITPQIILTLFNDPGTM